MYPDINITSGEITWNDALNHTSPWAVLATGHERALDTFARLAPSDVDVRIVRGSRCENERDFFREWAAALQFPYYFGHNWDAFNECLNDLEWIRADRLLIALSSVENVLVDDQERWETVLKRLRNASRSPGVPPEHARDEPVEGPRLVRFVLQSERSDLGGTAVGRAEGIGRRAFPKERAL